MAILFDGVDDYYSITDSATLTLPNGSDWSVGIWVYVTNNSGEFFQYVVSNNDFDAVDSFNIYLVEDRRYIQEAGSNSGLWKCRARDSDGTRTDSGINDGFNSLNHTGGDAYWRLIVVTMNQTDSQLELWFCLPNQTATLEITDGNAGFNAINGGAWNIGRRTDGDTDRYFHGAAAEFFVLTDTALSQAQITSLGTGQTVLDLGLSPAVYLPMNSADATLSDLGSNGNDATRNGNPTTFFNHPNRPAYWSVNTGGSTLNLSDYGFKVEQAPGVGISQVDNSIIGFGLVDGAVFQRSRVEPGQFSLIGTLKGDSVTDLHTRRQALHNLLTPGPIELQYDGGDRVVQASALYDGGLELSTVRARIEQDIALRFLTPDPFWETTVACSASMLPNASTSDSSYLWARAASGSWYVPGGNSPDFRIDDFTTDGSSLYAGGNFGNFGPTPANYVARFNGSTWSALGAGLNGRCRSVHYSGSLYVGGQFTTAGGGAASRVASWDGSTWSALGSGANSTVRSIIKGYDSKIYIGGEFTTAGGASADRAAVWDGSTWTQWGDGFNEKVISIVQQGSAIYVAGEFTAAGSVKCNRVAKWTGGPEWESLASGLDAAVVSITAAPDGSIYAAGNFDASGPITACYLARWNGNQWHPLSGKGARGSMSAVTTIGDLILCSGNTADEFGGASGIDKFAFYNGSLFFAEPIDTGLGNGIAVTGACFQDVLFLCYTGTYSPDSEAVATITNQGTADTYPIFSASGPGRLWSLKNYTAKTFIYCDINLAVGEVVEFDFRPGKKTAKSSAHGNVLYLIKQTSDISTFRLAPGNNNVSLYIEDSALGTAQAKITWRDRYFSVDS